MMNSEINLMLSQLESTVPDGIRLALSIHNISDRMILLPFPEITGLEFIDHGGPAVGWYAQWFESSNMQVIVLEANDKKIVDFLIQPNPENQWGLDLRPGHYKVVYRLEVNDEYFHENSHSNIESLNREAEIASATLWTGHVISNEIQIVV